MATTKLISKMVTEVAIERKAVELDSSTASIITEFVTNRDMLTKLEKTKKELEAQIKAVLEMPKSAF